MRSGIAQDGRHQPRFQAARAASLFSGRLLVRSRLAPPFWPIRSCASAGFPAASSGCWLGIFAATTSSPHPFQPLGLVPRAGAPCSGRRGCRVVDPRSTPPLWGGLQRRCGWRGSPSTSALDRAGGPALCRPGSSRSPKVAARSAETLLHACRPRSGRLIPDAVAVEEFQSQPDAEAVDAFRRRYGHSEGLAGRLRYVGLSSATRRAGVTSPSGAVRMARRRQCFCWSAATGLTRLKLEAAFHRDGLQIRLGDNRFPCRRRRSGKP